jgi:Mn-dependent DtxR family transcriptional regulator
MIENNKVSLNISERNILKNMYTSVTEQGVSRIRTNQELKELYKTPNLVAEIKRRLARLGHVIRLDQTSVEGQV